MPNKDMIVSPDVLRDVRLPPGQVGTKKWPAVQGGKQPEIDLSAWRFRLTGLVEKECSLSLKEFLALPRVEVRADVHCVEGWSILDSVWEGVSASEVRGLVRIRPEARFAMVQGAPAFETNLSLDDLFAGDVLFAVKRNGAEIDASHGAPVRLIVPRLYFWKSAKWVTGVEFVPEERLGYWERRGYHRRGDPWKEERYSEEAGGTSS